MLLQLLGAFRIKKFPLSQSYELNKDPVASRRKKQLNVPTRVYKILREHDGNVWLQLLSTWKENVEYRYADIPTINQFDAHHPWRMATNRKCKLDVCEFQFTTTSYNRSFRRAIGKRTFYVLKIDIRRWIVQVNLFVVIFTWTCIHISCTQHSSPQHFGRRPGSKFCGRRPCRSSETSCGDNVVGPSLESILRCSRQRIAGLPGKSRDAEAMGSRPRPNLQKIQRTGNHFWAKQEASRSG